MADMARLDSSSDNSIPTTENKVFHLDDSFFDKFSKLSAPFGNFDIDGNTNDSGLGEFVYYRTYSRKINGSGRRERWHDTVRRVVEGCFEMQRVHCLTKNIPWDPVNANQLAERMFELIFNMKFTPPGRGLWAMGTPLVHERKMHAALYNCYFTSTSPDAYGGQPTEPYCFLMDMCMLGGGVGFDTLGSTVQIYKPEESKKWVYSIEDTREGWVDSLRILLTSYMHPNRSVVEFDYSKIREAGVPLKTFGGISAGPAPLQKLHDQLRVILDKLVGGELGVRGVVDIMNLEGQCVVSGNVRRSSEIAFGNIFDKTFRNLKNYSKNPDRMSYGWCSNNSVIAPTNLRAKDYLSVAKRLHQNGEPGIVWLENGQRRGRMIDPPDTIDSDVGGTNPCGEIVLTSNEACNLVEVYLSRCGDIDEFIEAVTFATMYATTVSLGELHWEESRKIMSKKRRIGVSVTGVAQFLTREPDERVLVRWLKAGYAKARSINNELALHFGVTPAVRVTTVKPSGTISLLGGSTPGIHYPESKFYIRRVRVPANSEFLPVLREAGIPIEPDVCNPAISMVAEFVVNAGVNRSVSDLRMVEQLRLASLMQTYWSDNAVSCTISFDPDIERPETIAHLLEEYQLKLKGAAFLPRASGGGSCRAYAQLPYEEISEEEYKRRCLTIRRPDYSSLLGQFKSTTTLTTSLSNLSVPGEDCRDSDNKDDNNNVDDTLPESEHGCDGDRCLLQLKS